MPEKLTKKQLEHIRKNRVAFAGLDLASRLELRKVFQESVDSTMPIFRPSKADRRELRATIKVIDDMNLATRLAARKRQGMNQL
jgi:uncharacterized membrane protein